MKKNAAKLSTQVHTIIHTSKNVQIVAKLFS